MRLRFAISLIIVALVSIGSMVVFASVSTAREINTYMFRGGITGVNELVSNLEQYYQLHGSWEGAAVYFSALRNEEILRSNVMGNNRQGIQGMMRSHILLTNEQGRILFDTLGQRVGGMLDGSEKKVAIQLLDKKGTTAGYLYSTGGMQFQPGAEKNLITRLNLAARNAALLAGGVAILLALVLGYLILRPVKRLTVAANQIAGGDLGHRVPVEGNDELAKLGIAFNTMAACLETAQLTRKAMTADIAHELRTPLAVQRAILEAIQDGMYPLEMEQIKRVADQNQSLTRLVDDLRTLALADAGELKMEKVETDVCSLARRVFKQFQPQASSKNIQLLLSGCDEMNAISTSIDPFRIGQVINNLLSNALRHSPANSTVTGTLAVEGDWYTLTIRDRGAGIPPEELENIFERFHRANQSRSRDEGGTGLGLAIARQLARAHRGELTARNHPEGGAEFTLRLPGVSHSI